MKSRYSKTGICSIIDKHYCGFCELMEEMTIGLVTQVAASMLSISICVMFNVEKE